VAKAVTSAARRSRPSSAERRQATALRRAERQKATRRKLIEAAARVIGRYGFGGCSIGRVTSRARVAHGTFYLYFQSQQDMFDLVLPTLGGEMLDSIAEAVGRTADPLEVERLGFTANVNYIVQNPYMNRVTFEAQLFTPKVYASYIDGIIDRYVRSFRRTIRGGRWAEASDVELRQIARMIVSARESVLLQLTPQNLKTPGFVDDMIATYLDFVKRGLDL
jgi:AcrR family transcriptional regulator